MASITGLTTVVGEAETRARRGSSQPVITWGIIVIIVWSLNHFHLTVGVEKREDLGGDLRYPCQPRPDQTRPLRESEDADSVKLCHVHIEVSFEDFIR